MFDSNLFFTYIISIPILSIINGILNFNQKSKVISNIISILTKTLNIVLSIIIIKYIIANLNDTNLYFSWSIQWVKTYYGTINLLIGLTPISAFLLLITTIISFTSYINYISNNQFEEKGKYSRTTSLASLYDTFITLSIISNSYIQIAIFLLLSSITQFAIMFNNSEDKTESDQINNMAIITIFFDYMIIVGAVIFSNNYENKINIINNLFFNIESKEIKTIAYCMILSGSMLRAGIIPFSLTYFTKKKFFNDITAKIIATGNTIMTFWLLFILIPNKDYMPNIIFIFFIGLLNVTSIALILYSITQSNIMKITGCLTIANTAIVVSGMLQKNIFSLNAIISSAIIPAIMLITASYLSKISKTEEIKEIQWKEKPAIMTIYIIALLIISGLPPFSGVEKFFANSIYLSNSFHLSEILYFCFTFVSIRIIFKIFFTSVKDYNKKFNSPFNISIEEAGMFLLISFISLIEIDYIVQLTENLKLRYIYNILPSILGVISIILYQIFYKNKFIKLIREKIKNSLLFKTLSEKKV